MTKPSEDDVYEQMHSLMHAMRSQMHDAVAAHTAGLPHMAWRALAFFARNPGSTLSDLVEHAGRDKGQIARLIKDLVEQGYLERTRDLEDGRSHQLSLTDRGRAVQRTVNAQRKRAVESMVSCLSDAERTQLGALLRRLGENVANPRKK